MRISTQKYATALCESAEEAISENKPLEKIVKNFIKLLEKHHQLENLQFILDNIEKYYSTNEKFTFKASIKYAGPDPQEKIKAILQERNPKKAIVIKSEEDAGLLGGSRIVFRNCLIDSSIFSFLEKFKEKLKND